MSEYNSFEEYKEKVCPYRSCEDRCLCIDDYITQTKEFKNLLKAARRKRSIMMKEVGKPVPNSDEVTKLYISYPESKMTWTGKYWDIPKYTNGTTRHARALFRITNRISIGGGYCVCVDSLDKYEDRRLESEYEKLLSKKVIEGRNVEIVWTWEWRNWDKDEQKYGAWFLSVGAFYLAVRIDGNFVLNRFNNKIMKFN